MGRSLWFRVYGARHCRPIRTRFRCGSPPEGVNPMPGTVTRRIIMQKARGQARPKPDRPPTARRHGVSGSVSSPSRGSSHRSVALLGSLSVVIEYLALGEGPRLIQAGFLVPDPTRVSARGARYMPSPTGLSPAVAPRSSGLRLTLTRGSHDRRPHDPADGDPRRFRLVPVRSPLLGESRLISSPPGTEMFQFPGSRGRHPGIDARWAAPPGISQPSTPAIADDA